jgi:hypothetical protein
VPLILILILWQMVAMKIPVATWMQNVLILAGNIVAIGVVVSILARHFKGETVRTKRAFEPTSLIGTMQPAPETAGD